MKGRLKTLCYSVHRKNSNYLSLITDAYENVVAERVNGILKQEFDIDKYDMETKLRRKVVNESIQIHNEIILHFSNHYLTPNQTHNQSELKMKTYKTKNQCKNVFALV